MVWEASDPYLYLRSDRDGRMLIRTKAGTISAETSALLGGKEVTIGRAANMARVWLAAGFGGNGIAFSAMAAEMPSSAPIGSDGRDIACFDPYRFSP